MAISKGKHSSGIYGYIVFRAVIRLKLLTTTIYDPFCRWSRVSCQVLTAYFIELDEVDYLHIHLPHVCIRVAVVDQMDPFDEVAYYSLLPIYTKNCSIWVAKGSPCEFRGCQGSPPFYRYKPWGYRSPPQGNLYRMGGAQVFFEAIFWKRMVGTQCKKDRRPN